MPSFKLNYRAFFSSAFIYKFTISMVDGLLNMSKVSGIYFETNMHLTFFTCLGYIWWDIFNMVISARQIGDLCRRLSIQSEKSWLQKVEGAKMIWCK